MKHSRTHVTNFIKMMTFLFVVFDTQSLMALWELEAGAHVYIEDSGSKPEIMLVRLLEDCNSNSKNVLVSVLSNSLFKQEEPTKQVDAVNIATRTGCIGDICVGETVTSLNKLFEEGVVIGIFEDNTVVIEVWEAYFLSWNPRPLIRVSSESIAKTPRTRFQWPQFFGNGIRIFAF